MRLPFKAEYAKSSRGACKQCGREMEKGSLRLAKMVENSWAGAGDVEHWHHFHCFFRSVGRIENISDISGIERLRWADQERVRDEVEQRSPPKKRSRVDEEQLQTEQKLLKDQTDQWWALRDRLDANAKGLKDLKELLEFNKQEMPTKKGKVSGTRDQYLDRLADIMLFGALEKCPDSPQCQQSQYVFSTSLNAYVCLGNLNGYTKCEHKEKNPRRRPFEMPDSFRKRRNDFWREWEFQPGKTRFFSGIKAAPTTMQAESFYANSPKPEVSNSYKIAVSRRSNPADLRVGSEYSGKSISMGKSKYNRDGTTVDFEAKEYESFCTIYKDPEGVVYNAPLNQFNISSQTNMYYKIQLFQTKKLPRKYYLFRSWGAHGTIKGGTKETAYGENLIEAIRDFKAVFLDKTGNRWEDKESFVKKMNRFLLMDLDQQEDDKPKSKVPPGSKTSLAKPIQDLIQLIFDQRKMTQTLQEFEIDLERMPLGKLSKKQIGKAYKVLAELLNGLDSESDVDTLVKDAANHFYTLIPHLSHQPLNDKKTVEEKLKLLNSLSDLEAAVSAMKLEEARFDENKDPIDAHYETLKTDLEVLNANSSEYQLISEYVRSSHGPTHTKVAVVEEIFRVARQGESEKYEGHKSKGNRMLLWHGSRIQNFVGILSQGLRIAPPEAPTTGWMFGKGIYLADMISKSANYCKTEEASAGNKGLLILSEVALGNSHDLKGSDDKLPDTLPPGKHSTLGLGRTVPNPASHRNLKDVTVPLGKPIKNPKHDPGDLKLQYNEYVVYDSTQVQMKYLVKCRFDPIYDIL